MLLKMRQAAFTYEVLTTIQIRYFCPTRKVIFHSETVLGWKMQHCGCMKSKSEFNNILKRKARRDHYQWNDFDLHSAGQVFYWWSYYLNILFNGKWIILVWLTIVLVLCMKSSCSDNTSCGSQVLYTNVFWSFSLPKIKALCGSEF